MFQRHLKKIRVVVGLLFFIFTAFLFLDFRNVLTSSQFRGILFLQFVPSLIKFVNILSLASAGFIIILLFTALFGRVYCSAICPLGILQDIVSYISIVFKKKKNFRFSQPWTKLRYIILAITVLSLLAGSTYVLGLLDPYSNFGRFVSDFARPVFIKINNGVAAILERKNIFFLYPVDLVKVNLLTFIFPALMFILVVVLSFGRGRLYCNTVCPVGSLLGLLSKISFFKIKINPDSCTKCGKCSKVCKSECINIKDQSVDFSRCVDCFNCLRACPENAIKMRLTPHKFVAQVKPEVEPLVNERRAFLAKSFTLAVGAAGISRLAYSQSRDSNSVQKNVVCPPGSKGIKHYSDTCTSCHLCVSACPTKVLQPAFMEYGLFGMMQPRMDYNTSFCNYDCTLCGEVCPTGAIQQLTKEVKQQTQVGVAHFTVTNCIVFRKNTSCGACSEHCPTKAVNMVPYKGELTIPEVNPKICIGCGGCEYACPARPEKAIRVIGHELHQKALKPKENKLKPVDTSQDFPF